MSRSRIVGPLLVALTSALLSLPHALLAQRAAIPQARSDALGAAERFDRAYWAWDAGRYDQALEDLRVLLASADADAWLERVAELTGEIWSTREVAKDARAVRWSPDARHLAYEMGPTSAPRFRVVRAEVGFPVVVEGSGAAPSFAPDAQSVAWIETAADGPPVVHWQRFGGGGAEIVPLDAAAAIALTLVGRAELQAVVITGNRGDSSSALRVRDLGSGNGTWRTVATGDLQPIDVIRSTDGRRVIVTLGQRGPFARAQGGPPVTTTGGTPAVPPRRPTADAFAELRGDLLGPRIAGVSPTFSGDGTTLAWIEPTARDSRIRSRRDDGASVTAATVSSSVAAIDVSPDGSSVAYQATLREDLELFVVPTDGSSEPRRLTREIQHDILPQFLSADRLLAAMGEPRHRRSYLYDLASGSRTRLFHNNSVRTVAPEYEWAPSPDGTRIAIVAERDGDTVTPHRHLFLTDLASRVTRAELVARVDSNLVAERALRTAGQRMFASLDAAVRDAVAAVDVGRIYGYEKDLFGFDSKYITQPGNWKATEYLLAKYKSFGLGADLQPFRTTVGGREVDVANVLATIPGTVNPELIYVVGAHFDSRAEGPGADDNTSGTAMILEAARVLASRPLPATVMFVSFTGEEGGLRGAREFGRRMKDSIHVVGALNNDMMGWANDHRMDNTIRFSNRGIRDVQHAAAIQYSRLITYDAFYYKSTDAQALFDAWGDIIGGIGSYPILGNPHYHQSHDVLETINHQQLAETSRTTVATIMLLASSPSRVTGLEVVGARATWKPSPEKGVVRYLVRWGPATDPTRHAATVSTPSAALPGALPGWKVAVKAVNGRGLEGWDWARADVR